MDNFLFIKMSEFLKPECKLCNQQDAIDYNNLCIAFNFKGKIDICRYHNSKKSFKKILTCENKNQTIFYHDDNDILKRLLEEFKDSIKFSHYRCNGKGIGFTIL